MPKSITIIDKLFRSAINDLDVANDIEDEAQNQLLDALQWNN